MSPPRLDLPGWMEALRVAAGPLLPPAVTFARDRGPWPFPRGREGIRRLAAEVEAFAYDLAASDDDDSRFVEGAGALLSLLLLDHVGRGGHVERAGRHLLALGVAGFIDPFEAIDAALDAERPSSSLARAVEVAEAEAAGEGPKARLHTALEAALGRVGARQQVRERFEFHVELDDGIELDLTRFAVLVDDASALDAALDRLASLIIGSGGSDRPDPAQLFPRLVHRDFVGSLGAELATTPVTHELACAYVQRFSERARFVTAREAESLGRAGVDLAACAIGNLEEAHRVSRYGVGSIGGATCLSLTRADGLAASVLLSPGFRGELLGRLGSPLIVGIPHRDRLVALPLANATKSFFDALLDERARAPHGILGRGLLLRDAATFPSETMP